MEALAKALLHAQVQLQVYHWNTTSLAVHGCTDEYHAALRSGTDRLVEIWPGGHARIFDAKALDADPIEFPAIDTRSKAQDVSRYAQALREKLVRARASLESAPEMVNVLDDMLSETAKFLFLLTLK